MANSLNGFLQVFAQKSLEQLIADAPRLDSFTVNLSDSIAEGGTSVVTRLPTTVWSTANDLTNGWGNTDASSSAITTTLKLRNYDVAFNELEWATITPTMLQNLYMPSMVKQLANSIVVDAINNVSSSYYTNTVTVNSSSLFTVTGATASLAYASTLLTNNEVPEIGRSAYFAPAAYQALVAGVTPTYIYGSPDALREYKGLKLIDFEPVYQYPRFYGATKPAGGDAYSSNDKLIGICLQKQALVVAMRQPLDTNFGGPNAIVASSTATDKSSGLSIQVRYMYDVANAKYRIAAVALYGTSRGNSKACVPVITNSV